MLGDDPDAGHMAAQPDSSPDPPETLSEAPLLIVSTPSTPILRETAVAQDLINKFHQQHPSWPNINRSDVRSRG